MTVRMKDGDPDFEIVPNAPASKAKKPTKKSAKKPKAKGKPDSKQKV